MKFTYGSGQRPLDGYVIKRGIGKGGFGEVYYALSDGGKEVALKLVRGDLQVELRGVAQCLNLKHPNLVALYDLRTDNNGDHWVVMEYAAGVILYEMVTGRVPFDGESAGEILMKHLTSPPDLNKVPPEWKAVVSKALSKNPAHRYASMAEMARDVEAVGEATPAPRPAR